MNARVDLTAFDHRLSRPDDVLVFLDDVQRGAGVGGGGPMAGHAPFARAYRRMTLEMIASIPGACDPGWMSGFVVDFAERYRVALRAGDASVGPWRIAFGRSTARRPLRSLLLGINAHMAYDLAVTLAESSLDDAARRHDDYFAIDRALALALDPIQASVARVHGPWLQWADWLVGPMDDRLWLTWFSWMRERAWQDAQAIHDGRTTTTDVERRVTSQARALARLPL